MEVNFGQEAYASQFDSFMRHYLTVKTGEIPNVRAVYDAFKQYARSGPVKSVEARTEELIADIRTFAGHYCAMALGTESDQDLKTAFRDIRELKVDVAYPFFLELYHDYTKNVLTKAELLQTIRLVESYVFRRAVIAIPTNSMNKTFATFSKVLKKDRYVESIQAHFLTLPSYRRFPGDEEFEREIQARDLYNFRSRSYWLRRMENYDRKERVVVDEYTIEHIMPQNENVSDVWKAELGPDWQDIHAKYLHTLGNLTLTGYNPELSDRPFSEEKKMKGGFAESPLRLNQGLAVVPQWNRDAIEDRAKKLAKVAASVWASPKLPPDVLQAYKPTPTTTVYSIDDHPHLAAGPLRPAFDEFRKQVLALDPCVTEEFLKLYVAYKAETNFVDVVPQAKRLRLSLNLAFPEINDPRGLCKDVTGLGRWGNGDVEVGLSSLDDLPYIIGLVRQAYEKQMGSATE
jgi:predicted transport protein